MKMKISIVMAVFLVAVLAVDAEAGLKKLMTVRKARIVAQRALVESVFGLKVKTEESVTDMLEATFFTTGQSKTKATVVGINMDEVVYDAKKDIAKATASITLRQVSEQTGIEFPNPDMKFTRVGFATSSQDHLSSLKAMRVAEIDAYSSLAKESLGFELESGTSVENYILKSDVIKTKMIAALFLAELVDYGWDEEKNAFVTLSLDLDTMAAVMGKELSTKGKIKVTGYGATVNDLEAPKPKVKLEAAGQKVKEQAIPAP